MKASDLLVACLEREGVDRVFGVPGEELEDLLFSLRGSSVTFVPIRPEQRAASMTDVHGRLTGDAGVCLGTLGSRASKKQHEHTGESFGTGLTLAGGGEMAILEVPVE